MGLVIDEFALTLPLVLTVHDGGVLVERVALRLGVSSLVAAVSSTGSIGVLVKEFVELVGRWFPWDGQLLQVDNSISVHDLGHEVFSLLLIHTPDILVLFVVSSHEVLELFLRLGELLGELLKLLGVDQIFLLHLGLLLVVTSNHVSSDAQVLTLLFVIALFCVLVHTDFLSEHAEVEAQFLFIELVNRLHVFHTFFEDLHLPL